jgi:hypothetical protein
MPPPLYVQSYGNLRKCGLKEVLEQGSSLSTIDFQSVVDIAFVFHANTLEHEHVNCAGMARVFYTRYQYDNEDNLLEVDNRVHVPFSTFIVESYPSRIWYSIVDAKNQVAKVLNDSKQYKSCKKTVIMKYSLEAWFRYNEVQVHLPASGLCST